MFGAWPSARSARPSRPDYRKGGGVVLWDAVSRKPLRPMTDCYWERATVETLAFSPDGKDIAAGLACPAPRLAKAACCCGTLAATLPPGSIGNHSLWL